jgi:hypothetical protein
VLVLLILALVVVTGNHEDVVFDLDLDLLGLDSGKLGVNDESAVIMHDVDCWRPVALAPSNWSNMRSNRVRNSLSSANRSQRVSVVGRHSEQRNGLRDGHPRRDACRDAAADVMTDQALRTQNGGGLVSA